MSMQIRIARLEDADTIADFNVRMALETEHLALDRPTVQRGVRAALADASKAIYFVAEVDERVAGQLMITHEWSDWRNGDLWWIQSVYVFPDFRRAGVFKSLYQHVRQAAREAGAVGIRLYVESENRVAQQSYTKLGMTMTHYALMEEML